MNEQWFVRIESEFRGRGVRVVIKERRFRWFGEGNRKTVEGVGYEKEENKTSETQLIKYIPGSTDKKVFVAFLEYLYFFRIFGVGTTCEWLGGSWV
jgi:hypothetical protein